MFGFFFFFYHSSLLTQFPSLINHHSSLKTPNPIGHHHSLIITQYFSIVCGTHTLTQCQLTFLSPLFFSPLPFLFVFLCFSLRFSPVILSNPSMNPTTEIKVWTCDVNLHRHPASPTSWASLPSTARSPLMCRSGADLWSWLICHSFPFSFFP